MTRGLISAGASAPPETETPVAAVLHELKAPLASLLGYARIVRNNWTNLDDDKREECFDIIDRQGRRMLRMLQDLLESYRLDEGMPKLRREHLDLRAIIGSAVQTATGIVESPHIVVDVPDRDLGIYGDPHAIEHVLTNLIENALKHGDPATCVAVIVRDRDSEVCIDVWDDGPGIDPDELPHIFDRYRRATTARDPGIGLGLYIVQTLVAAHGGRVLARSKPGRGTTFTVSLPRRSGKR